METNEVKTEYKHEIDIELISQLVAEQQLGLLKVNRQNCTVTYVNPKVKELFDLEKTQCPFDLNRIIPALQQSITSDNLSTQTAFQVKPGNAISAIQLNCLLLSQESSPDGSLVFLCWTEKNPVSHDSTSHDSEFTQAPPFERILELAPTGIIYLDGDWHCQYANQNLSLLCELSSQELLGTGWTTLFSECEERLKELVANLISSRNFKSEFILHLPSRNARYIEFDMQAYPEKGESIEYIIGSFIDVTEREQKQEEIYRLATYDRNTGLYNRAALREQLARYLDVATRLYQNIHIVLIGINSFKRFNDFYGHQTGDELLIAVGKIIRAHIRTSDIVAKVAGDEFAILIPGDLSEFKLMKTLESLMEKLSLPYNLNGNQVNISFSMGVTSFKGSPTTDNIDPINLMNDIFRQVDIALITAKQDHRVGICRYTASQSDELISLYSIVQELPKAISERQFRVFYQPIFNTKDLSVESTEALIRWPSPELGMVGPDQFIAVAESQGLIESVEECVIEEVAKELASIGEACGNLNLRVAINLSGQQLCSLRMLKNFVKRIEELNIDPAQVTLEITEQVLVIESNDVLGHMNFLKQKGFRFALDDFGTGYSSLSYLTRFPIDYLKLDRSFIVFDELDEKQTALIEAVIALSRTLNLKVVAEGIETKKQLENLTQMGCDYVQGYYLGRPMPLENFEIIRPTDE